MNILTETRGDIGIVRPIGRIDSATAHRFEEVVNTSFENGAHRLVLDFSELEYISSAGMRSTLAAGKKARTVPDGELVLCSLGPQVSEIFGISGFVNIFNICPDLDTALAQLKR